MTDPARPPGEMMEPKITYRRDSDRYIVMWGDDRIGFVRRYDRAKGGWNAVDTTMAWSRDYATRDKAGQGLLRQYKRALAAGEIE